MNKLIFLFTISSMIYSYFFYKLGNTIFRINQFNEVSFNIIPLFTEGFIGPIRSLFLLIRYNGIVPALTFIKFKFFRLSNPYSALFFFYYINKIIEINFKK